MSATFGSAVVPISNPDLLTGLSLQNKRLRLEFDPAHLSAGRRRGSLHSEIRNHRVVCAQRLSRRCDVTVRAASVVLPVVPKETAESCRAPKHPARICPARIGKAGGGSLAAQARAPDRQRWNSVIPATPTAPASTHSRALPAVIPPRASTGIAVHVAAWRSAASPTAGR